MVNIKTKSCILGISAALILCGCSESELSVVNTEESSSAITVSISETVKTAEPEKTTEAAVLTEPEKTAEITEAEKTTEEIPNVTDYKTDFINKCFEVREFPDDEIVPAEWIPVYSFAEAAKKFDEIVSLDVSNMDTADAIIALANKTVIFLGSFTRWLFWDSDLDHPYYSENYENPFASELPHYANKPLYPIILSPEYYTDIQEIYDLGAEIYIDSALNDENDGYFYYKGKTRKAFIKENGNSYVDELLIPNWDILPFRYRSYIEIVSETEDKCSFIWHTPNWEMLGDPPEEGWEFNYYSCPAEAVYEDGSWKLSDVYIEGYSLRP